MAFIWLDMDYENDFVIKNGSNKKNLMKCGINQSPFFYVTHRSSCDFEFFYASFHGKLNFNQREWPLSCVQTG